jgi:hypothetical protein
MGDLGARAVVGLTLFTGILFGYSVTVRSPWFGTVDSGLETITSCAVRYSVQWSREGAFRLGFSMPDNPPSIEFPTLSSREPYFSYPPGHVLPLHLISELSGREASIELAAGLGLAHHLLIALFLSFTAFLLMRRSRIDERPAMALSLLPPFLHLAMPGPLYWHQAIYFSDTAVLLPFVLIVFLEVVREKGPVRSWLEAAQSLLFFYSMLTDWLALFILAGLFLKRLARGERAPVLPALSVAGAVALYATQLIALGIPLEAVTNRILLRTGFSPPGRTDAAKLIPQFWLEAVEGGLGRGAVLLLWLSLILASAASFYAWRRRRCARPLDPARLQILGCAGLMLFPVFLHLAVFRGHSGDHSFAAAKFAIPMASIPLVLAPAAVFSYRTRQLTLPLLTLAAAFAAAAPFDTKFFPPATPTAPEILAARAVARHTGYSDVVFSPEFQIPAFFSFSLLYSMKRVYPMDSVEQAQARIRAVQKPCRGVVILLGPPDPQWLLKLGPRPRLIAVEQVDLGKFVPRRQIDSMHFYELPPPR